MNFRLLFAPEIEGDVLDGYHWYESKAKLISTNLPKEKEVSHYVS